METRGENSNTGNTVTSHERGLCYRLREARTSESPKFRGESCGSEEFESCDTMGDSRSVQFCSR